MGGFYVIERVSREGGWIPLRVALLFFFRSVCRGILSAGRDGDRSKRGGEAVRTGDEIPKGVRGEREDGMGRRWAAS